jgi:hypothetical protein
MMGPLGPSRETTNLIPFSPRITLYFPGITFQQLCPGEKASTGQSSVEGKFGANGVKGEVVIKQIKIYFLHK